MEDQGIVDQIKATLKLEDVIEADGYPLGNMRGYKRRGSAEHCNSLEVDTKQQLYYWFSQTEGGDLFTWVMKRRGLDFRQAAEELARRAHLPEPRWSGEEHAIRVAARQREDTFEIAQQVMQAMLWCDEGALAYCRGRGWTDETIREAGLGFTGREVYQAVRDIQGEFTMHGVALDHPNAVAITGWRGDVGAWAAKWGVELEGSTVRWREWGFVPGMLGKTRIVYPHYMQGRIRTFSGRNVFGADVAQDGSKGPKSYNLPVVLVGNKELFCNRAYTPGADEVVIVEGQADAVSLGQWDIAAVALGGTHSRDLGQVLDVLRKRHARLYWGMDSDAAGQATLVGRKRDWPLAGQLGPMVRVVRWPETRGPKGEAGTDANDWLRWGMGALGLCDYGVGAGQDQGDGAGGGGGGQYGGQAADGRGASEGVRASVENGSSDDGAPWDEGSGVNQALAMQAEGGTRATVRVNVGEGGVAGDEAEAATAGADQEPAAGLAAAGREGGTGGEGGGLAAATSEVGGTGGEDGGNYSNLSNSSDELLERAVEAVRGKRRVSVAHIQRRLSIGYPRARKLLDEMVRVGVLTLGDSGEWLVADETAAAHLVQRDGETREERVGRLVAEQTRRARELLKGSLTLVEEMCYWAGKQEGADRDEAIRKTFRVIVMMDKMDRANYRQRLADLLTMAMREFNDVLKAAGAEDEGGTGQTVETFGGFVDGWLLEYLYDATTKKARLAYRDPDRKIGAAEAVEIKGVRYVPRFPNEFVRAGGVLFPSEVGTLKPLRELVAIVQSFIHENYLVESQYIERIAAYYVCLTWMYDAFNAICYLRAMGEPGSGKSEFMRRLGLVCYRFINNNGAGSPASFFRTNETYRGTCFIDEADLQDGGDMANMLVKFLNLGAMKGNMIVRTEEVQTANGKQYEEVGFQTFGPKLVAMRKDFKDDAVGTRALTIKLIPREPIELKERGIPLNINRAMREQAAQIRNLLLRWRLETWEEEIEVSDDDIDLEISARLNQVTLPIKTIARGDDALRAEIERFLRAYNAEMVLTRSMTIPARVVEALWRIWQEAELREKHLMRSADGEGWCIMIGDIATVANRIIDEMNAPDDGDEDNDEQKKKRKKEQLTARGVGSIIRNELQLFVGERKGRGYPVYWDSIKMQALARRYGVAVFDPEAARAAPGAGVAGGGAVKPGPAVQAGLPGV